MKRRTITIAVSMLVLVCAHPERLCNLSRCRRHPPPWLAAAPANQQAEEAAMNVMDQFFEAYRTYDMDKMLSLHTDDAVWTWIDQVRISRSWSRGQVGRNRERRDPSHVRARPWRVWL